MNVKQTLWVGALCVLLMTGAVRAGAQEQALRLTLLQTFIQTQNDSFYLSSSGTQAFLPTVVGCPKTAKKGCMLKIEVSGTFLNMGNMAIITVTVSGGLGLPGIDPDASLPACWGCGWDTRTLQWMQRSVPAGAEATINVEFSQPQNVGQASDRTETIELFKN